MSFNSKMKELADVIREKSETTSLLSVDGMISTINSLSLGIDTSDATATESDISLNMTAYGRGELITGTLIDSTPSLSENVVTIPSGRIRDEQTITIEESGGIILNKNVITVGKGYVKEDLTKTVDSGSVSLNENSVLITEGYVETSVLNIPNASVTLNDDRNVVTITEGYVESQTIEVTPKGEIDLSDANVVSPSDVGRGLIFYNSLGRQMGTMKTSNVSVFENRVAIAKGQIKDNVFVVVGNKMNGGEKTLSPGMSYTIPANTYVSEEFVIKSRELPNNLGSFYVSKSSPSSITTKKISSYDPETGKCILGTTTEVITEDIFAEAVQGGIYSDVMSYPIGFSKKLIREGILRRYRMVDGVFIDEVWGTKLKQTGNIYYNYFGVVGSNPAPLSMGGTFHSKNTLHLPEDFTISLYVKPFKHSQACFFSMHNEYDEVGGGASWGGGACIIGTNSDGCLVADLGGHVQHIESTKKLSLNNWNHIALVGGHQKNEEGDFQGYSRHFKELKLYLNGELVGTKEKTYTNEGYPFANDIFLFCATNWHGNTFTGQIDDVIIYGRQLNGTSIHNISNFCYYENYENENEYEQKYPVFYASATEGIKTGNSFYIPWDEPVIESGMWVNYVYKDNRSYHIPMTFYQNFKEFYENGDFSFCFDFSCLKFPGSFGILLEGEGAGSCQQIFSEYFSVIRFGNIEIKMIFGSYVTYHYEITTNTDDLSWQIPLPDGWIDEISVFQNGEKILSASPSSSLINPYEEGETVTFILTHKNEEGTSLYEKRYRTFVDGSTIFGGIGLIGETENNINVPESSDIATSGHDLQFTGVSRSEVKVGINNILTYNRVLSDEEMENIPKENQDFE